MPILKSNVRDARPSINAEAESEKKLFNVKIEKGFIEIRRGNLKGSLLRIKYAEVVELGQLVAEVATLLQENQYTPDESLSDGYEAGDTKYVPANPRGPRAPAEQPSDTPGADPTNPVAANTAAPAPEPEQATFVQQSEQPQVDQNNPFQQ